MIMMTVMMMFCCLRAARISTCCARIYTDSPLIRDRTHTQTVLIYARALSLDRIHLPYSFRLWRVVCVLLTVARPPPTPPSRAAFGGEIGVYSDTLSARAAALLAGASAPSHTHTCVEQAKKLISLLLAPPSVPPGATAHTAHTKNHRPLPTYVVLCTCALTTNH